MRQIYEKAIEELDVDGSRQMCMRYAELETKLGEIDRARAIYVHCSQKCDPRVSFVVLKFILSLIGMLNSNEFLCYFS